MEDLPPVTAEERLASPDGRLEGQGLACLVMGEHAVRHYGVDRSTLDFDLRATLADSLWNDCPTAAGRCQRSAPSCSLARSIGGETTSAAAVPLRSDCPRTLARPVGMARPLPCAFQRPPVRCQTEPRRSRLLLRRSMTAAFRHHVRWSCSCSFERPGIVRPVVEHRLPSWKLRHHGRLRTDRQRPALRSGTLRAEPWRHWLESLLGIRKSGSDQTRRRRRRHGRAVRAIFAPALGKFCEPYQRRGPGRR